MNQHNPAWMPAQRWETFKTILIVIDILAFIVLVALMVAGPDSTLPA